MNVITATSVTRRFAGSTVDPVTAVDRVSVEIAEGSFTAIEGPSGSGKTTLLGLLAGLEVPDSGSVNVLGHDLGRLSPAERARLRVRRMGIVFQSFGLIASLRVGDNVALPLALAGVSEDERIRRSQAALAEVGLDGALSARVDELSGGERQRVGVARALVTDPVVILADEPTGSLDEANGSAVIRLLVEAVRRRGSTLILVTHDPVSASQADDRYQMRDGRLSHGVLA